MHKYDSFLIRLTRAGMAYSQYKHAFGAPTEPQVYFEAIKEICQLHQLEERHIRWVAAISIGLERGYVGTIAIFIGARLRNSKGRPLPHPIYNRTEHDS